MESTSFIDSCNVVFTDLFIFRLKFLQIQSPTGASPASLKLCIIFSCGPEFKFSLEIAFLCVSKIRPVCENAVANFLAKLWPQNAFLVTCHLKAAGHVGHGNTTWRMYSIQVFQDCYLSLQKSRLEK